MLKTRLSEYNTIKARIKVYESNIEALYEQIFILRSETPGQRIEARILSAPTSTPVQGGHISDPTAAAAFSDNQHEIQEVLKEVAKLRREKAQLQREVDHIDAALGVLNEVELFVVSEYHIQGNSWQQVVLHWERRKGIAMTERWARKVRDNALARMESVLMIA